MGEGATMSTEDSMLDLSLIGYVTLGKPLTLSGSQFYLLCTEGVVQNHY